MNSNSQYKVDETSEKNIDVIELLFKYLRHWKWFALSVVICLAMVFIYLRYATPIYEIKSSVLIKDDKKGGGMGELSAFKEMNLFNSKDNVDNELEVLKTSTLMEDVVKKMGNYVRYTTSGRIKTVEIYGKECPVLFSVPSENLDSIPLTGFTFDVHIRPDGRVTFTGTSQEKDFKVQANRYDTTVVLPFGLLQMKSGAFKPEKSMDMTVSIFQPIKVAEGLIGSIDLGLTGKTTSVVNINLNSAHVQKGIDFLNTYIKVYNNDNMEDRNLVAQNTANFIEERLSTLTRELTDVEQKVEGYKQSEQLTDITSEAKLFLEQSNVNESKRLAVETQIRILSDLEGYLTKKENQNQLLPAGTGIESQSLNLLISEYNELILRKNRISRTATGTNQAMIDLNYQIDALAENFKSSLSREKRGLNITRDDINRQYKLYESRIRSIPRQEREYMEIQRQQSIKAELYLFLLQKKEENYLSMTVVVPKAKVIDNPRSTGIPVSPKRSILLLAALFIGMLIPVIIITLLDLFRFQVENKSELEKLTKVPILGEIPRAEETGNVILRQNLTNPFAEMFRLLRTNLLFVLGNEDKKVIQVTSSLGGEGKTFTSINLALSLAFLDKKVLVIGLDVRKPRLGEYLGLDNKSGMTLFLSGHIDKSKLIRPSGVHENMYIITAGPIPPNPNELLAKPQLDVLIAEYRKEFDYIIIDTAPVGAVSDTFLLNRFADVNLYVVRAEYTHKLSITEANSLFETGKLTNMYFVFNSSDIKKGGYRYGYGKKYGYGYGYGYGYSEDKKKF